MNLLKELIQLSSDADKYGIEPEHMDRLIRIGEEILLIYGDNAFATRLTQFSDYFERWGVCTEHFENFFDVCLTRVRGLEEAEV